MNLKQIATTLAVLGTGSLALAGCEKDAAPTEVPGAADAPAAGEASCAADDHPGEGHCGDDAAGGEDAEGEGSCGGEGAEGEGSCGADGAEEAAEGE